MNHTFFVLFKVLALPIYICDVSASFSINILFFHFQYLSYDPFTPRQE